MSELCSKCNWELPEGAKFCPDCGHKVKPPELEVVGDGGDAALAGFTIEFNFSTSANYPFAVDRAAAHLSYAEEGEGKQKIHRVTYDPSEVDDMVELLEALKGIRNRRVWVDGEKTMWDEAFGWMSCYSRRKASYIPDLYCFGEDEYQFNLWGCIHSGMQFGPYAKWLTHGRFDKSGTFALDKERIRHELLTALHRFRLCPAYSPQLVEDVLTAFPDQVNPKRDKNWDYQTSYDDIEGPGSLVIKVKQYGMITEERAVGVRPKSLEAARNIFGKMNRKLPSPRGLKFD